MHSALVTSECWKFGFPSGTYSLFSSDINSAHEGGTQSLNLYSDTQTLSTIKVGLLLSDVSTLISNAAKEAIGNSGIARLESFFNLQTGWDGAESKAINLESVEMFSNFFDYTNFRHDELAVFMSAYGNVVINWPEHDNEIIELEFSPSGIDYFIERNEEEGTVTYDNIGLLFDLINPSEERFAA